MYFILVSAGLALILYVVLQKLEGRRKNLPPGPIRWPLIGNLIDLALLDSKYIYNALTKLASKYGEVMFIKTGVAEIVVISGYEAIKEALGTEAFLTRFSADDHIHQVRSYGKPLGVINSSGDLWYQTRRFAVKHLKGLGFGRRDNLEVSCAEEYEALTTFLDDRLDSEKQVKRFDLEDPEGIQLLHGLDEVTEYTEFAGGIATAFPVLIKWFPRLFGMAEYTKQTREVQKIVEKAIEEVKAKGSYKEAPENFVEAFLQTMDQEDGSGRDAGIFTDLNLASTAFDLAWGAQADVSATTGQFFRLMLFHPEVQQKMRDEVNAVVGPGVRVAVADKSRLHYCRAVIQESLRFARAVTMLGRINCEKDTIFRGYTVPANATILLNMMTLSEDRVFWTDPENYRPERFLDVDGNFVNCERSLSFGSGKRDCPGTTVAESGLFMYACNLIRDYAVLPIPGHKYSMENAVALVVMPKEYKVYFKKL